MEIDRTVLTAIGLTVLIRIFRQIQTDQTARYQVKMGTRPTLRYHSPTAILLPRAITLSPTDLRQYIPTLPGLHPLATQLPFNLPTTKT